MKINEFIEQFNELDLPYPSVLYKISATKEESFAHGVVINVFKNNKFEVTAARLPEGVNAWDFYGGAPFSSKMLELMAELAETPPEEREDAQQKYVILNSDYQFLYHWDYFKIGDKTEYLRLYCTDDPKDLIGGSYTLEELEKEKRWLPEKWRGAINSMLTPLDVALKKKKIPAAIRNHEAKMKHDDLD